MNCSECEQFQSRAKDVCNGVAEGVSVEKSNQWRAIMGLPPIGEQWDVSNPSRGLGDTVAKFTHYTGISKVVHAVSTAAGVPCGCGKRQEALNQMFPAKAVESASHRRLQDRW